MIKTNEEETLIPELFWAEKIAIWMDSKFTLPGTHFRFGLDPILGLIPIVGDISTMAVSFMLVYIVARKRVSRKVIILMVLNILVDAIIGGIPILGSLFDFGFKSNIRNINLLKRHYYEGKHTGSGFGIILLFIILFACVMGLIIYGSYKLLIYLFHFLH